MNMEEDEMLAISYLFTFRLKIGKQGLAPCGKRPWWSKVQKKRKQELYSDGS
jgi:hypothetical protein